MSTAKPLISALMKLKNARLAKRNAPYVGVKPGFYGDGDKLLGITVPIIRKTIQPFEDLSLKELEKCFSSEYHEIRHASTYILVKQYKKAKLKDIKKQLYNFYMEMITKGHINNWDLVDSSAYVISGPFLYENKKDHGKCILIELAKSSDLWSRRVSVISTFHHIRQENFEITLSLAEMLLSDEHDLIHKAVGWMLREIGKRDESVLCRFLDLHHQSMPRVMLRYSIEKLTKQQQALYLVKK